jgi:hypothetical protein
MDILKNNWDPGVDFIKETTMDKTNKVLLVLQDVI